MVNKSIVIFGAGKIGRSFIGQLFGLSGYEVIFSDINLEIVYALNQRKSYQVVIKGEKEETILVPNVRAISGLDKAKVAQEVSKASILAVSVGKNELEKVIPSIADGLKIRYKINPDSPLDIIIAENMRSACEFIHDKLSSHLPEEYPIDKLVGLVETSIGKMAPIMQQADIEKDPLMIFAEPYNNLIVNKKGFKGEIPDVKGLSPKENIKAWVDRKAFIHNLGHATAAYNGAFKHPEATTIFEVLNDPEVFKFTKDTMIQAAEILQAIYPDDFTPDDLERHINDLLFRFQNKALKDTIFRVGQDRPRKLGPDDRFVGIIRIAEAALLKSNKILEAMAYAFYFKVFDENGRESYPDINFNQYLSTGLEYTLEKVCGFDLTKDAALINEFKQYYENIKTELERKFNVIE